MHPTVVPNLPATRWQIRGFVRGDLARLFELDQSCFPPTIAYSRAELHYFLVHPNCSCWIAEGDADAIAGFIIVDRGRMGGRLAGHIITLDVEPSLRRQGLGSLLIGTAEAKLKQEGAAVIRLEVAENNTGAQQFYRTLGFVIKGRIARYYGRKIDADVLEKDLSSA